MADAAGLHPAYGFGCVFLVEVLVDSLAGVPEFLAELLDVLRCQFAGFAQVADEGV